MAGTPPPFYQTLGHEAAVFEAAHAVRAPVLLLGPTGSGKTRFLEHMAWRLGRPLVTIACHDDMTASDLVGRHLLDAGGTRWVDGPLTRAVREGGICYLDEIVEARSDTLVVIHPLADTRRALPLERRGELVAAHPDFHLVASYNPEHQTKALKPSTRQRFVAIGFSWPEEAAEARIVAAETGLDAGRALRLARIAGHARHLAGQGVDEGLSTRMLVRAAQLLLQGLPLDAACEAALVQPATDDPDARAVLRDAVAACGEGA